MVSLLFIIIVVALGILVSVQIGADEANWFTYFRGAVAGLFLSGIALEVWNTRRKKKEEEEAKKPKRIEL